MYIGVSYGTAYTLGDFASTDVSDLDSGFADRGNKFDLYGGYFLDDRWTLTGTFRYQNFDTKIDEVVDDFNEANAGSSFTGRAGEWEVYSLLVGTSYKINISPKFAFFPRVALGPMLVDTPGLSANAPDANISQNYSRSSETGFGIGYEAGIGLRTNLGKRLALLPTFTFSGGFATVKDVVTTTDNVVVTSNYTPLIQSFNLGISIAYLFY